MKTGQILIIGFLLLSPPVIPQSADDSGISIDCSSTNFRFRECMRFAASPAGLLRPEAEDLLCNTLARTNGQCPDTITSDQSFPRRKAQSCTDADLLAGRSRCLYGRGSAVDTTGSLPTCDASEWGHVALVEDLGEDRWCDGSAWQANAPSPGQWRATMIRCGSGATHDVWPNGGPAPHVNTVAELPTCSVTYNNVRVWQGASNATLPHVDGTLMRCRDPGGGYVWEVNAVTYRETIDDWTTAAECIAAGNPDACCDGPASGPTCPAEDIESVCISGWQNSGREWNTNDPFWIVPIWEIPGESWLELQARDSYVRKLQGLADAWTEDGKSHLEAQRDEPPD